MYGAPNYGYNNYSNNSYSNNSYSNNNYSNNSYANNNFSSPSYSNQGYTNKIKSNSPLQKNNAGSNSIKDDGFQFGTDLDFDINPSQNGGGNFVNDLDFGPSSDKPLKEKTTNSRRERSARRFLENNDAVFGGPSSMATNNTKSNNPISGSQFQFENRDYRLKGNDDILGGGFGNFNKPSSNSIIGASDFPSRRGGGKARFDESDNMMVGDNNFGYTKKKSENTVLFGMESRRGHKV